MPFCRERDRDKDRRRSKERENENPEVITTRISGLSPAGFHVSLPSDSITKTETPIW